METIYFQRLTELKRTKEELENKLEVSIKIIGKRIEINGDAFKEYEALIVLEAINFGFSAKKSLLLKDEENIFIKIPIKSITRRKNLKEVRARIIGREGKTKKNLQHITGCEIILNGNEVGIIGETEHVEEAKTALTSLIKGSKESNVYRFVERMNAIKKERKYTTRGIKFK